MIKRKSTIALLEAVRSSLWNRPTDVSAFENLTDLDWHEMFMMSFHQTVEGLTAAALQNLPPVLLPPMELRLKWLVRLSRIQESNKKMETAIAKQYELFSKNGIRCLLHKGHGVSQFYPEPSYRTTGDIDWFFPTKPDFDNAQILALSSGAVLENRDRFSSGFNWGGLCVEHHRRIIQPYNPLVISAAERYVESQLHDKSFLRLDGTAVEIPNNILNLIQINAHIFKHQIGYGIGLRQLCDSFLLYKIYGEQIDGEMLKGLYKALGMLKWSHLLHQMLVDFFELPLNCIPYPIEKQSSVKWMEDYILRTGNFAFYDRAHPDVLVAPGERIDRPQRLFKNFCRFMRIAPMEALSFPIYQLYKKSFL